MNFLLKIVEGPNKGAEIALPEGVAVTLGKSDTCDIVLADRTLPAEPLKIEVNGETVLLDGSPLEQFVVAEAGATVFAVGPADAPWKKLQRRESPEEEAEKSDGEKEPVKQAAENGGDVKIPTEQKKTDEKTRRGRPGCFAAIAVILVILVILAVAVWHLRRCGNPYAAKAYGYMSAGRGRVSRVYASSVKPFVSRLAKSVFSKTPAESPAPVPAETLEDVVARFGLSATNSGGRVVLTGDFATRRERLAAAACAYAASPGVHLDFCDDESFRTSAEDALSTLTEGALEVASFSKRNLAIGGRVSSPSELKRILTALSRELPKLRGVDCSAVAFGGLGAPAPASSSAQGGVQPRDKAVVPQAAQARKGVQDMPVCGILVSPYPCIVLRNGSRILEGATFGGNTVLKIEADSVTLTNSAGRMVWKP